MPKAGFDTFLMDSDIMKLILEMRDPNIPLSVTIAWLGYPYEEVSYDRLERIEGKSRWTFAKKIKLALDSITAVSYLPIRLISLFGAILALVGFAYALFIIIFRFFYELPVQGWASSIIVTLVIGGTQLISLGIIGEYLWRTLEVSRNRPLWHISNIESSNITSRKKPILLKVRSKKKSPQDKEKVSVNKPI
jgi:dolichol-phosphate mannosyltransferase